MPVESEPASGSQRGQARRSKTKSATKKPPKAPRFTAQEIEDALEEWIGLIGDGKYLRNEVVLRIQATANEGKVAYEEVMKQIKLVVELSNLGTADGGAPPAARGKKMTHIAISQFLGRSVGWVRNCGWVHGNLPLLTEDPRFKTFNEEVKLRGAGVKTLLEGIKKILDEPTPPPPSRKGKEPAHAPPSRKPNKRPRHDQQPAPFQPDYEANTYVDEV